jgi:sulfocyanin
LSKDPWAIGVLKLTGALMLGGLVGLSASLPAFSAPRVTADHKWVSYNSTTHVVKLTLIASYAQPTYNFDGGTAGALTITVPLHSRIRVTFTNASAMMPHGAEIVKYTGTLPGAPPPAPAFKGAASPNYLHGTQPGDVQHFSFDAGKAGKYLVICPVHNHVSHGHWDWFVVSAKAKTATAVLK